MQCCLECDQLNKNEVILVGDVPEVAPNTLEQSFSSAFKAISQMIEDAKRDMMLEVEEKMLQNRRADRK